MVNYKCDKGHSFQGNDFTIKCPEPGCGSNKIYPENNKPPIIDKIKQFFLKYKYHFAVIGLIILLLIIANGCPKQYDTYRIIPKPNYNAGYIEVIIEHTSGNQIMQMNFSPILYNRFTFKLNGEPVTWGDNNIIPICSSGEYRLTWTYPIEYPSSEQIPSGACSKSKEISKLDVRSRPFIFDSIYNDCPLPKLELSIHEDSYNCMITVNSNFDEYHPKQTIFISFNGKNGNYSRVAEYPISNLENGIYNIYAYIGGTQDTIAYANNGTNCQIFDDCRSQPPKPVSKQVGFNVMEEIESLDIYFNENSNLFIVNTEDFELLKKENVKIKILVKGDKLFEHWVLTDKFPITSTDKSFLDKVYGEGVTELVIQFQILLENNIKRTITLDQKFDMICINPGECIIKIR
jgi:hypothetical protein